MLEPLRRREDALTGLHANTQIPKVDRLRAHRRARRRSGAAWTPATFFWETVVGRRTVAFGGNSVREHFNPAGRLLADARVARGAGDLQHLQHAPADRAAVRSRAARPRTPTTTSARSSTTSSRRSIPEHGGFVYFTPIRPRHYRVYSQPSQCFWCCVGTGHGEPRQVRPVHLRARERRTLYVNLFIASELRLAGARA